MYRIIHRVNIQQHNWVFWCNGKTLMRPREGGLPFSVRLLNDSLRLLNLLNPPELESSLLGEPGIMLVWNIKQRSSFNFWGEVWDVICKNRENKSSWILCNIGNGWKKDTVIPAARNTTTPYLISSVLKKCCVINRLISWVASICNCRAVCVYVCVGYSISFLSRHRGRANAAAFTVTKGETWLQIQSSLSTKQRHTIQNYFTHNQDKPRDVEAVFNQA